MSPDRSEPSPLERVERLHAELVAHYGGGADPELRAAAKLLLVALDRFRRHGGERWAERVDEYVAIARDDPERFHRIVAGHASTKAM